MTRYPIATVIRLVCQESGVSLEDIAGRGRTNDIVSARRVIGHLARTCTIASWPEVAEATTGRGHATWLGAAADARGLLDPNSQRFDPRFRAMVARVTNQLAQEHHRGEEVLHRVPGRQLPTHP